MSAGTFALCFNKSGHLPHFMSQILEFQINQLCCVLCGLSRASKAENPTRAKRVEQSTH